MKYIISESQDEKLNLEKKADIFYKLLQSFYPKNYKEYSEDGYIGVYDTPNKQKLLFYFDLLHKEFVIGGLMVNEFFKVTNLPFLDYSTIRTNKREMFDNIMKIFSKKYYGWNPIDVKFHYF